MERNPLETQERIVALRRKFRENLEDMFSANKVEKRLGQIISEIENLPEDRIKFDKHEIAGKLRTIDANDKTIFLDQALRAVEPAIIFFANNPTLLESVRRENMFANLAREGYVRLSESLYFGYDEKEGIAHIHLAPAAEMIKEKGVKIFMKDITDGLVKMASILKNKSNFKKVTAISWIVNEHPKLMEKLGFEVAGEVFEPRENDPFGKSSKEAWISRQDFLTKYLAN